MVDEDRSAYISFTETKEYTLELDFADMAKVLGVSRKKLSAMIEDGDDFEPSEAALTRMRRRAETVSEEVTVDDVSES